MWTTMNNKTDCLLQDLSKGDTKIENQTKTSLSFAIKQLLQKELSKRIFKKNFTKRTFLGN